MKQLVFIHGGEAFSDYDSWMEFLRTLEVDPFEESSQRWKHFLAQDLGEEWQVLMPEMPNKLNAKYAEWEIWFEKYIPYLQEEVVLVGHSLGAMFLARYLSEHTLSVKVSKLFLLAGMCIQETNAAPGGEDGEYFFVEQENFKTLNQAAEHIYILKLHCLESRTLVLCTKQKTRKQSKK